MRLEALYKQMVENQADSSSALSNQTCSLKAYFLDHIVGQTTSAPVSEPDELRSSIDAFYQKAAHIAINATSITANTIKALYDGAKKLTQSINDTRAKEGVVRQVRQSVQKAINQPEATEAPGFFSLAADWALSNKLLSSLMVTALLGGSAFLYRYLTNNRPESEEISHLSKSEQLERFMLLDNKQYLLNIIHRVEDELNTLRMIAQKQNMPMRQFEKYLKQMSESVFRLKKLPKLLESEKKLNQKFFVFRQSCLSEGLLRKLQTIESHHESKLLCSKASSKFTSDMPIRLTV